MLKITHIEQLCYPIDYAIDRKKFDDSFITLLSRLGITYDHNSAFSVNLTHLPGLSGTDRWKQYTGDHPTFKTEGVDETDFTEHLSEMSDLYMGQVIQDIQNLHNGVFQGRIQLIWIGPKGSYPLHKDLHTTSRYHIPVITNEECFWIFKKDSDSYKLHMPADDRVWYVDPTRILHTFVNNSNTTRCHLVMTSGKD
jgi:Aspartyl/Asparaginyl beta-hydroxylase